MTATVHGVCGDPVAGTDTGQVTVVVVAAGVMTIDAVAVTVVNFTPPSPQLTISV